VVIWLFDFPVLATMIESALLHLLITIHRLAGNKTSRVDWKGDPSRYIFLQNFGSAQPTGYDELSAV